MVTLLMLIPDVSSSSFIADAAYDDDYFRRYDIFALRLIIAASIFSPLFADAMA